MQLFLRLVVVVLLLIVVTSAQAQSAGTTHTASSYEVAIPQGWELMTQSDQSAVLGEAARMFPNVSSVDLSSIDMFAFDTNSSANFATNYNIVVVPQTLEMTEANRKVQEEATARDLKQMGITVNSISSRIDTVGQAKCITLEMQTLIMGMPLFQRSHLFSDDKQAYVLTFSTPLSEKQNYTPVFDTVLASFASTTGTLRAEPDLMTRVLPLVVSFGVIGVIVVIVVFVVINRSNKSGA